MLSATRSGSRMDVSAFPTVDEDDGEAATEQALAALKDRLNRELKIKEGSENMLEALNTKKAKQAKEQRQRVEAELIASNMRIKELRQRITDTQRMRAAGQPPSTPIRQRNADPFNGLRSPPSASRSGAGSDNEESTESPTFALAELLQALEVEGMMPEYYVSRGNQLVDLFKRHPTLKYDLVWSVFGLRMQVMLLSESREVVAAGYRMTRHAISDRASLKRIRDLNTDFLVIRYAGFTVSVHDPCADQELDPSTTIEKPTWSANRLSNLFVLSSMLKMVSRRFPELSFALL
jgi:rapamycin-insensitive companion of mTOR